MKNKRIPIITAAFLATAFFAAPSASEGELQITNGKGGIETASYQKYKRHKLYLASYQKYKRHKLYLNSAARSANSSYSRGPVRAKA